MAIQQSFHPTARLSIASVASEILRQWPIDAESAVLPYDVVLLTGNDPLRQWEVVTVQEVNMSGEGKVALAIYPPAAPSRNAAKRLASSLIRGLRPVNR